MIARLPKTSSSTIGTNQKLKICWPFEGSVLGQDDQFPRPDPSAGCGFSKQNFAGANGNEKDDLVGQVAVAGVGEAELPRTDDREDVIRATAASGDRMIVSRRGEPSAGSLPALKDASRRIPNLGVITGLPGVSRSLNRIEQRLFFAEVRPVDLITQPYCPGSFRGVPADLKFELPHRRAAPPLYTGKQRYRRFVPNLGVASEVECR